MTPESDTATLTFHGGARNVTGSNFLLVYNGCNILIDCGMSQGTEESEEHNRAPFPYDPSTIDVLFVTHAHIDHIGLIPRLMHEGFRGTIYSTPPTKDMAEPMFEDSVSLFTRAAEEEGTPPLYEAEDAEKALSHWKTVDYHDPIALSDGMTATLRDAGHILGSAMVEFEKNGVRYVHTGDLGNNDAPLLPDTESIKGTHYLSMESVYGDRNHEGVDERCEKLARIVRETVERGGTVMIPAFSIERTQELLYDLHRLIHTEGAIPQVPIYLDSPLAIKITEVYKNYTHYFNTDAQDFLKTGDDIFNFPDLVMTDDVKESMAINDDKDPKIIIAGSGMSDGGRIIHHEKRYLPDPDSTLLVVGYQAPGTTGRELTEGASHVELDGDHIPVKAHIETIQSYSAHKDSDHLIAFVEEARETLEQVYVVLGETESASFLAQRLRDFCDVSATVPEAGSHVTISFQ